MARQRRQPRPGDAARRLAVKVAREVARGRGQGTLAAAAFLTARVKEALSEPAPKARVTDPRTGASFYVATAAATPGAAPRVLSGRLRSSIAYEVAAGGTLGAPAASSRARVGTNLPYARIKEFGGVIRPRTARMLRFYAPVASAGRRGKVRWGVRPVFAKQVTQPPHPFLFPTARKYAAALAAVAGGPVRLALQARP